MDEEEKTCALCNWVGYCSKQYTGGCGLKQWSPITFDTRKYEMVGFKVSDNDSEG